MKGQTYYLDHVEFQNVGYFCTKETPDNPATKGSLKFKGDVMFYEDEDGKCAIIYG